MTNKNFDCELSFLPHLIRKNPINQSSSSPMQIESFDTKKPANICGFLLAEGDSSMISRTHFVGSPPRPSCTLSCSRMASATQVSLGFPASPFELDPPLADSSHRHHTAKQNGHKAHFVLAEGERFELSVPVKVQLLSRVLHFELSDYLQCEICL